MTEWQPIETAPKDGKWVLGFEPDGEYLDSSGFVVMQFRNGAWEREGDDYNVFCDPSHWMPLPATPIPTGERR